MIPAEIGGVAVVPLIIAIVALAKSLGLENRWAPLAAVLIGVLIMAGNQAAQVVPGFGDWYNVILWGLAAGLMAVGLYSGTKNTLGG